MEGLETAAGDRHPAAYFGEDLGAPRVDPLRRPPSSRQQLCGFKRKRFQAVREQSN